MELSGPGIAWVVYLKSLTQVSPWLLLYAIKTLILIKTCSFDKRITEKLVFEALITFSNNLISSKSSNISFIASIVLQCLR